MRWLRQLFQAVHPLNVDGARRISNLGFLDCGCRRCFVCSPETGCGTWVTIHEMLAGTDKRALLWAVLLVAAFMVGFGFGAALWE